MNILHVTPSTTPPLTGVAQSYRYRLFVKQCLDLFAGCFVEDSHRGYRWSSTIGAVES